VQLVAAREAKLGEGDTEEGKSSGLWNGDAGQREGSIERVGSDAISDATRVANPNRRRDLKASLDDPRLTPYIH
jgi:hypothetical protein